MQCAQLGLEPILGRAYLIPYDNNKQIGGKWQKVLEAQFQPGYQGLIDLAMRSGKVNDVYSMVVYENDVFDIEYGTDRHLTHKPTLKGDPGEAIGAYVVWELKDTPKPAFEFMPLHEIYKRRDKSQAYQYAIKNPNNKSAQDCPWIQWPEEMIRKTVVKHSAKMKPASIEMMQAIELDNAAEMGAPAVDFFSDTLLLAEGKKKAKPTVEDFDKLAMAKIDYPDPTFDKYLDEMAGAQEPEMSIEQFKIEGAAQFEELWAHFENWRGAKYPSGPVAEEDHKCEVCGYPAKSAKGLKRHTTQQHSGTPTPAAEPKEPVTPPTEPLPDATPTPPDPWAGLLKARENPDLGGEDAFAVACEAVFGEPERTPQTPEEAKSVTIYMHQIAGSGAK